MGEEREVRRGAAWRFLRAIVRAQRGGVIGAAASGLLWQVGAVGAPLVVKYAIDHGIVTRDRHKLLIWLGALAGVGLLEVCAGGVRHIYAIRNRSASDARVRDLGALPPPQRRGRRPGARPRAPGRRLQPAARDAADRRHRRRALVRRA